MTAFETAAGQAFPLGATIVPDGVNFCLYAKHAAQVELLLFDEADAARSVQVVTLDPDRNRTYEYWHVLLRGARAGQLYGYRVDGPQDPAAGLRYDAAKLLVDPYAKAVVNDDRYQRARAAAPGDNTAAAFKCVVADPLDYDWEGDQPLGALGIDAAIYELHVAGFTRHPNSGVAPERRGTYAGLIDKIPYLVDLGIRAVELMPIQQFDAQAAPNGVNYWGYQPVAWFAPHRAYSALRDRAGPIRELRDLVKALHRAGIEVILDVVFNHTAEGDARGPTLSLRGIDNPTYYLLDPTDPSRYLDDTGCGHTINGNETIVRQMILDCLRYWVEQFHVDGFRFDLASTLSRGVTGQPLARPPVLLEIDADPVLAGTKIIAEAWDAAGLYQVSNFAGDRWAVWNGRYRDNVRRFVKGDPGSVGPLADSLLASANLFQEPGRNPNRSVNFITAHDGFTLNDLVSYDTKHNEANADQNRDGTDANFSWNCGVEGPSTDPAIEALRAQQIKNFLTLLLLSEGRPMLVMGDEVRRTQQGNNNAYCQDNELSWFDWDDVTRHAELLRFTRALLDFHQRSPLFRERQFWSQPGSVQVTWHGVRLNQPDWGSDSHSLALELRHPESGEHLQVMLNAYWEPLTFELPELPGGPAWRRLLDTSRSSPEDFCLPARAVDDPQVYACGSRSCVVLIAQGGVTPAP